MSTETSKLPDKPSELILIALKDLRAAEASEKYDINMEDWHNPPVPTFMETETLTNVQYV